MVANNLVKVVIADDDNTIRFLLRTLLRDENYDVLGEASDGEEAVRVCLSYKPDVLFLDIQMPKLDGLGVLTMLREKKLDTAVIMVTGAPTVTNIKTALEQGVSGFVVKPFTTGKIVDAITAALKKRAG